MNLIYDNTTDLTVLSDTYAQIDGIYFDVLDRLVNKGKKVKNTMELRNVYLKICPTDDNQNIPIVTMRNTSLSYLAGELLWYTNGDNKLSFINKFSRFWNKITSGDTCNSAYGDIVTKRYGYNQLRSVVNILKQDKYSRRALINFSVPTKERKDTLDEICTISVQFLYRDDRLDCIATMRSNDVWTGMPYDMVYFMYLQHCVAKELGCKVGNYFHNVASLHLYDKNLIDALMIVRNERCAWNTRTKAWLNPENLTKYAKELYQDMNRKEELTEKDKEIIVGTFYNKNIFFEV